MKTFTQIFENSTADPLTSDIELIAGQFIQNKDYIESVTSDKKRVGDVMTTTYTITPKIKTMINFKKNNTIQMKYYLYRIDNMNGDKIKDTKFYIESKDSNGVVTKPPTSNYSVVNKDQLEDFEKILIGFNAPQPQPQPQLVLPPVWDGPGGVVDTFINNGSKIIESVTANKNGTLTIYTIKPKIKRVNQDMIYKLYKNDAESHIHGYFFDTEVLNGNPKPDKSLKELQNGVPALTTDEGEKLENVLRKVGNIEDDDIVDANTTVNPDNVFNEVKYNELLNLLRDYWTDFSNATSAYDEPAQED